MTAPAPERAPVTYDPELDNCAGGCRRNDDRRIAFSWFHCLTFACPGCFEELLGGAPDPACQPVFTLTSEQIEAGRFELIEDEPCTHICEDDCYDDLDERACRHSHCSACGGCGCPGYCDDYQTYNLRPAETGGEPA